MNELSALITEARRSGEYQPVVDLVPYARLLGMDLSDDADGRLLFRLRYQPQNIGNQLLPAIHGGVIAAFMEHSALLHVLWNLESAVLPKVVDFSIDYLRSGRPEPVYAHCSVVRQGQRVANVAVSAWQETPERVIATARTHFLLPRPARAATEGAP